MVVAYLEGLADGRRFFEALGATAAKKPVVLLKAGRTLEGGRAVSSHTGALAGSDAAFEAAVRQAGAVRARSVEELFDLARCLASQPLPRGRRLLVVTNGGGLGVIAADAARDTGLELAAIDAPLRARLRAVLPATASVGNPVDLVGDADPARYANALLAVGPEAGVDAALVIMTAQAATDAVGVARAILGATRDWTRPIVAALVGGDRVAPGVRVLEDGGVPVLSLPGARGRGDRRDCPGCGGPRHRAPRPRRRSGPASGRARRARGSAGVRRDAAWHPRAGTAARRVRDSLPGTTSARTADEAAALAAETGRPGRARRSVPRPHPQDGRGRGSCLASTTRRGRARRGGHARQRAARRPDAASEGFSVQPMAVPGKELLLGAVRDPQFGPLVMVGFGGVYVEVLRDTATRLAPITLAEADRMLDELQMAALLRGIRGEPPVDPAALTGAIVRFARLAADCPDLLEVELNPLVATPSGVVAVDARGTLAGRGDRLAS